MFNKELFLELCKIYDVKVSEGAGIFINGEKMTEEEGLNLVLPGGDFLYTNDSGFSNNISGTAKNTFRISRLSSFFAA